MAEQPEVKQPRALRNLWMGFGAVVAIVLVFVGYTMWSRKTQDADLAYKQQQAKSAQQRESDAAAVEELGGSDFKIIAFYASPGLIHRGDTVDMCYGVSNAKAVKLDPPEANVWPSANRCVQVKPKKTTTYTLTIDDGKGQTATQQLTITVK
ncbi:MAG TPA: hypothetical protein VGD60_08630 [Candidatus Acidoferrales bacterium]